jgi:hypothetical protein
MSILSPEVHKWRVLAAVFDTREQAEKAIAELTSAGFPIDSIGAAMRSRPEQEALIEHTGAHKTSEPLADIVEGGIFGGVVGALLSFGVLSVPGVGPVIAAGVLASAIAGAGIGAASGGIQAALTHVGFSESQADDLETPFNAGAAIVTVEFEEMESAEGETQGRLDAARQVFADNGVIREIETSRPLM